MTRSGASDAADRKNEAVSALAPESEAAATGEAGATEIAAEFARLAERLDQAGLGPADYLYAPLKWRLQHQDAPQTPLLDSVLKAWRIIADPPPMRHHPGQAAILLASSYPVSAEFLKKVVETFDPAEAVFCDASDASSRRASFADRLSALMAIPAASIFTLRVSLALARAGAGAVERRRIAEAAFTHAVFRRGSRAILREVKPECVVIANGNRPFEFALFAEAKARRIATVLLPFAELNPKPARFLSLCRGGFDLALPFSDHSAGEIRKLRKDAAVEVVGFPGGLLARDQGETPERPAGGARDVLYVCGNNFEQEAAALLRAAFADAPELRLRVRLHPRNDREEMRKLFGFVADELISDPARTSLAEDIASADITIMVRSTVALEAMFAGKPLIWLSPAEHRAEFADHPLRRQKLALFDAATAEELREIVQKLMVDEEERRRVAEEQWSRLRAAGYRPGYYEAVKQALRSLVDWRPQAA
jgi:hypothetical protein